MTRTLASGYGFPEAPCVIADGRLAFSDVQGGVYALSPDGSVEELVPKRRAVGGLVAHADGGIVMTGRDLRHLAPDGSQRLLLAAPDGIAGFNDASATPDGDVLAGALAWNPIGGEQPRPSPVWRVGAGGEVVAEWSGTVWPNGISMLPVGASFVVATSTTAGSCAGLSSSRVSSKRSRGSRPAAPTAWRSTPMAE